MCIINYTYIIQYTYYIIYVYILYIYMYLPTDCGRPLVFFSMPDKIHCVRSSGALCLSHRTPRLDPKRSCSTFVSCFM